MPNLHTAVFGPDDDNAPTVLAIHGLTGHAQRWAALADEHLPGVRVVAPDLLGHGHSPWTPPWSYEAHLSALEQVVEEYVPTVARPFVIVGHSFGGGLAIRLAQRLGSAVRGLVLLDPAQGMDPHWSLQVATDSLEHWDYPDAAVAAAAKRGEGWAAVPDRLLDKEIDDHLMPLANGRMGWRVSAPAAATAWSEMARPYELPPLGLPTAVIVASRVDPPFVGARFVADCAAQRAETVEFVHADCEHMVPFLVPDICADLIRSMIARSESVA